MICKQQFGDTRLLWSNISKFVSFREFAPTLKTALKNAMTRIQGTKSVLHL